MRSKLLGLSKYKEQITVVSMCILLLLLIVGSVMSSDVNLTTSSSSDEARSNFSLSQQSLVDHEIRVSSNDELVQLAQEMGFQGDGSYENPIIIEQLRFENKEVANEIFLSIQNVDYYFRVQYNTFLGGGILLNNVANGYIANNLINGTWTEFRYNGITGGGHNVIIARNTIFGADTAIVGYHDRNNNSDHTIIMDNELYGNHEGMSLHSNYNIVHRNSIHNNINHGIDLYLFTRGEGRNNTITCNVVEGNDIGLRYGSNSTVMYNTFSDNLGYGIRFARLTEDWSYNQNNQVKFNNLYRNGQVTNTTSQAHSGNSHTFLNNYYSDWTNPDADFNGIVDQAYPLDINDNMNNTPQYDDAPLASPVNTDFESSCQVEYEIDRQPYTIFEEKPEQAVPFPIPYQFAIVDLFILLTIVRIVKTAGIGYVEKLE